MAVGVTYLKQSECCGKSPCTQAVPGLNQWTLPDGQESDVCPRTLVTPTSIAWLGWYRHYQRQLLPAAGGLLDQTAAYEQAMGVIEQAIGVEQNAAKK